MKEKSIQKSKTPMLRIMREMKVGESYDFPINKYTSAKSTATTLGAQMCRRYSSTLDRVKRIVTIKRVS